MKLRKVPGRLLAAWCVLFAGYAVCEYRLFGVMLFDTTETIRESMFMGSDGFAAIAANIADVFVNGVFHADDVHKYIVLPVCVLYLLYKGVIYIRRKDGRGLAKHPFFLIMGLILFNCIVYGSYTWEAFRTLVETLLPPLKGWQFTRTVFFNPFLWYMAFIIVLKELYDRKKRTVAHVLMLACLLIVLGTQTLYNDFYNTVYTHTWMAVKGKQSESLSYQEFYSPELFEQIKKDISYDGAYAAAYGMHPAVLQYNGISTLDACLSYYSQDYKEDFRRIIAPALEQSEEARIYFDEWGARAYLFREPMIPSGSRCVRWRLRIIICPLMRMHSGKWEADIYFRGSGWIMRKNWDWCLPGYIHRKILHMRYIYMKHKGLTNTYRSRNEKIY